MEQKSSFCGYDYCKDYFQNKILPSKESETNTTKPITTTTIANPQSPTCWIHHKFASLR